MQSKQEPGQADGEARKQKFCALRFGPHHITMHAPSLSSMLAPSPTRSGPQKPFVDASAAHLQQANLNGFCGKAEHPQMPTRVLSRAALPLPAQESCSLHRYSS